MSKVIGIDISKQTFDVSFREENKLLHEVYANNLNRDYEVLTDASGKPVTNNVELNKATLEKLRNAETEEEINDLYERKLLSCKILIKSWLM